MTQTHSCPLESLFLLCWGQAQRSGNFVSAFMDPHSCFPQCFPVDCTKLSLCTRTSICHYLCFLSNLSEILKSGVSGLNLHFSSGWACLCLCLLPSLVYALPYLPMNSLLAFCLCGRTQVCLYWALWSQDCMSFLCSSIMRTNPEVSLEATAYWSLYQSCPHSRLPSF